MQINAQLPLRELFPLELSALLIQTASNPKHPHQINTYQNAYLVEMSRVELLSAECHRHITQPANNNITFRDICQIKF